MKWVLQKWEKEVHVESILHPTPSMNVDGSSTSVAEASSTPLDPVPPSSILSRIVVAAPFGDHPTSPTGCPSAEQIMGDVCKALSDSQGSFRPSMSEVEALLGKDWRQPLHVTAPGLSPQQFEFEARHFRDLTTKSYVTDCAQIVVYYSWAAQTALSADWDTMGVVWVVRNPLWNASCASAQRHKQLVKSWAERTLQASSIDMSFAPPLIVAQVYNMSNWHWVLRLLLIAPTLEYLCLKFDPMCDRPHIVGANQEESAVVDLIAEREGVEPQQRKKWSKILDAFGALAFAIAPLHSTFIQQLDGVSCHPACLLTLHCALSRRVVKGLSRRVVKGILQVPQDRLWLLREMAEATFYFSRSKLASTPRTLAVHWEVARMYPQPKSVDPVDICFSCDGTPHMACHECKVLYCALHASILCQSEICVELRQFWTANLVAVAVAAAVAVASAVASAVVVAAAVDTRPSLPTVVAAAAVNTRRGVWIRRKWYAVPPQYPQNADGQLRNDQAFCTKPQGELKTALFGMCTNNPTVRGKPRHADTKAHLIFKRVFCNYL